MAIEKKFDILEFTEENFLKVLKNKFITLEDIKKSKRHFQYLKGYFGKGDLSTSYGHDVKTIIVENKYVSRSYLEDYQEHYILAYRDYNKLCKRIHFFKEVLNFEKLKQKDGKLTLLEEIFKNNNESNKFWNSYIGYIVIRPIPRGVIGASLILPYPEKKNDFCTRKFSTAIPYKVNIYGVNKTINTLIFVEQDTIVGACATSAIYIAMHKLSRIFNCPKPNQKKISDAAGISVTNPNRKLKNKQGLTSFQMCRVFEKFGLEPELQDYENQANYEVKAYLYAYLKMGLPSILGISIEGVGNHAITLTGYEDNDITNLNTQNKKMPLVLKGGMIETFYAHDDQIGPFAKIQFQKKGNKLVSSWWDEKKTITDKRLADIFISITPLSNRIRIPFEAVYLNIASLNEWFKLTVTPWKNVVWDIYLNFSNNEKEELQNSEYYDFTIHKGFLIRNLPKYVWVAELYIEKTKCLKIIFDASEIDEDFFSKEVMFYTRNFKDDFFKDYLLNLDYKEYLNPKGIYKCKKDEREEIFRKFGGLKTLNLFRKKVGLEKLKQ